MMPHQSLTVGLDYQNISDTSDIPSDISSRNVDTLCLIDRDEAEPTDIVMSLADIARASRALSIVNSTREIISDCLANNSSTPFVLRSVCRGLALASDLVASIDSKGEIAAELQLFRLDRASISASESMVVARLQAAALSGMISSIVPVVYIDEDEEEGEKSNQASPGYL